MCRLFELAGRTVAVEGFFFGAGLRQSRNPVREFSGFRFPATETRTALLSCQNSVDQEMPLLQCEGDTRHSRSK